MAGSLFIYFLSFFFFLFSKGDVEAHLNLAHLYKHGQGVAPDLVKAHEHTKLAADKGGCLKPNKKKKKEKKRRSRILTLHFYFFFSQ